MYDNDMSIMLIFSRQEIYKHALRRYMYGGVHKVKFKITKEVFIVL